MDDVFKALADPSRRAMLDSLRSHNGQTLTELGAGMRTTRQSVSKHLGILEAANLVTTVRRGREKLHYLNADPINAISERWIRNYERERIDAITELKTALESISMTESTDFVYTTYIEAPPELIWRALTDRAFTSRYWGVELDTDWKVGSRYSFVHNRSGLVVSDDQMVITKYEPFSRLSYTWQGYPKELSDQLGLSAEQADHAAREPRSLVSFDLEPQEGRNGAETKLTVMHTGFQPGSVVLPDISGGWPKVLSWLKSFLESGRYRDVA
ncbi:MAG: metalloregulator ArsR/SmtB family transcription factor [Actinomycetota bacterium]